jgi:hypothetical protein
MKRRDFVVLLIPLFVLTVLWVIFNVYHNLVTSTIEDPLAYQIIAIEGKFDMDTLSGLQKRKNVSPVFTLSNETFINQSQADTIEPTESLESAELSIPDASGTQSGEIEL